MDAHRLACQEPFLQVKDKVLEALSVLGDLEQDETEQHMEVDLASSDGENGETFLAVLDFFRHANLAKNMRVHAYYVFHSRVLYFLTFFGTRNQFQLAKLLYGSIRERQDRKKNATYD